MVAGFTELEDLEDGSVEDFQEAGLPKPTAKKLLRVLKKLEKTGREEYEWKEGAVTL